MKCVFHVVHLLFLSVLVGTTCLAIPIDFTYRTASSYSNQDIDQNSQVLNRGLDFEISGNSWRKVEYPYTMTSNTILEFDFSCSEEGEIHGIGLETDDSHSQNSIIQLFGTQTYGIQGYRTYTGSGVNHFRIPIGQLLSTGNMLYVTFINDKDAGSAATLDSTFSNVQLYEQNLVDEINFNSVSMSSYSKP